jgi:hypothetical protein
VSSVEQACDRLTDRIDELLCAVDFIPGQEKAQEEITGCARDLALAPLLEVQKGLEELQIRNVGGAYAAAGQALRLVNAQIEAVQALGREP